MPRIAYAWIGRIRTISAKPSRTPATASAGRSRTNGCPNSPSTCSRAPLARCRPPSIDLHFTLTAADGTTLSEGQRSLRDPAFLSRGVLYSRDDPLRFEKRLLDEWLRREFPQARASRS